MRPTGKLHLGHLVGALQNWAELQRELRLFLFRRRLARADERLRRHRRADRRTRYDNVADWIAAGHRSRSGARSSSSRWCPSTPSCTCCCRWSCRCRGSSACRPTRSRWSSSPRRTCRPSAFSAIRCCRRADVIIYDAHYVPVGEDQVPHLELSREVVRRFHNFYGEVFVEPQPLLTHVPAAAGPRQPQDEQELRQHDRPLGRRRTP